VKIIKGEEGKEFLISDDLGAEFHSLDEFRARLSISD